jgi:hypothetical protein
MVPFPTSAADPNDCYPKSAYPSANGVQSLCAIAYKAAVNASGVVWLTPLPTGTLNYYYPTGTTEPTAMPCENMKAIGLLNGGPSSTRPLVVSAGIRPCLLTACILLKISQTLHACGGLQGPLPSKGHHLCCVFAALISASCFVPVHEWYHHH